MSVDSPQNEEDRKDRWRPPVAPYKPRPLPRSRSRKPSPGQLSLPGMEDAGQSSQAAEQARDERRPVPGSSGQVPDTALAVVCPNCGGREFDEDGDCVKCWEPAVKVARVPVPNHLAEDEV